MKIERETDNGYERWSIEMHPWVEKSAAVIVWTLLAGSSGIAIIGGVSRLLGH